MRTEKGRGVESREPVDRMSQKKKGDGGVPCLKHPGRSQTGIGFIRDTNRTTRKRSFVKVTPFGIEFQWACPGGFLKKSDQSP